MLRPDPNKKVGSGSAPLLEGRADDTDTTGKLLDYTIRFILGSESPLKAYLKQEYWFNLSDF